MIVVQLSVSTASRNISIWSVNVREQNLDFLQWAVLLIIIPAINKIRNTILIVNISRIKFLKFSVHPVIYCNIVEAEKFKHLKCAVSE